MLRWFGIGAGSLIGLGLVAYAIVYGVSERILRRTYVVPATTLAIPTDQDSIREGRRLAIIRGCFGGCHGKEAEGHVLFDDPMIARIVAPNLTAAVRQYSDVQIAVMVRNGIRPDGRTMVVMPAEAFTGMTDADLGHIIAFLRNLPPAPGLGPSVTVGPLGRLGLVTGRFHTVAQLVADAASPPEAATPEAEHGRYLARTICAQCHGTSLRGAANPNFTSPDLRVVGSYSPEAFTRLLRTGVALGERTVGEMSVFARNNLSQLTDSEISDLYRYLRAMR